MSEKETIISWVDGEDTANVFTYDGRMKRQLDRYPHQQHNSDGGTDYTVPIGDVHVTFAGASGRSRHSAARGSKKTTSSRSLGMSEEDRKAAGLRLQTAKAAKFGLTLEQYKTLHLRPGVSPTPEQIAELTEKKVVRTKSAKSKAKDLQTKVVTDRSDSDT